MQRPTFDTGPSEPQPHGVQTTFHFMVPGCSGRSGYVELCDTFSQDFTLFELMQWLCERRKLPKGVHENVLEKGMNL
jgi:hypothetical protein